MPATHCPRCRKTLSDAPAAAQFCMFCGIRLSTSADVSPHDRTADVVTRSYQPGAPSAADDDGPDSHAGDVPPRSVGGYSLMRILGAGGQGSVYEAEQSDSGRRVAVKLLSSKFAGSATSVERFRQEGRLASQISHPRCVFVYGADTDSGVPFIVMELMPGTTLKDLVDRRGPLPVGEAIARILDVIDGLIEAHRLGVIHRDVKPSNCFITADDRVKVGDFGLSKSLGGSNPGRQLTTSGKFVGTVLFAPPEQIRGEEVGYDSDVYSVAATLYYLLTAQAPHQHESLTAALAKAISEPPPPVRSRRPDVPKELDRAVLRGLERDRDRRWQSLEEFRDALLELLPARYTPARPRSVFAAYLVDGLIGLIALQLPIEILREVLIPGTGINVGLRDVFDPAFWVASILYFALFEGLLGGTPGKWLLNLRVVRLGETAPPGFFLAAKRTGIFHAIWFGMSVLPFLLLLALRPFGAAMTFVAVILGFGLFVAGVVALANQMRKKWGFRGVHDFATGTRVVQRPLRVSRRRIVSRYPNPLERTEKPAADLPETVGGFAVRGQVGTTPEGGLLWLAEDRSLSRRVLLWLRPTDGPEKAPAAVVRPTRPRRVGDGGVEWNGHSYEWTATVAPAGAPLADVADPKNPISWADARTILEQLADELAQAEADGTLPQRLGADQLWVEPAGRLHLLDAPLPPTGPTAPPSESPLGLLRQTASLALQGLPATRGERVRAPLPPHARVIADRLTARDNPYRSLADLRTDLAESHAHPARVTAGVRATHVGVQAMFLIVPHLLAFFLLVVVMFTWFQAVAAVSQASEAERIAKDVRTPSVLADLARTPELRTALAPANRDATVLAVVARAEATRARAAEREKQTLTGPERALLGWYAGAIELSDRSLNRLVLVRQVDRAYEEARAGRSGAQARPMFSDDSGPALGLLGSVYLLAGIFLVNRVVCALAFRGGLSWALTGLTLVTNDGRPCGRLLCAARSLAVWVPVIALGLIAAHVQYEFPTWVTLRVVLTVLLIALIIAYAVVAVRYPSRPPHDRLLGTHIVPV
jgi:hypothetical protein